ncbi:MAG: hypothetical protein E7396_03905 [Ruminococcaceae bacterium]|nr:hypothetical protein [Oscillospiraceae bacterium]
MKKLLSLALVLTMLFTIIAVPSVSAAAVGEYLAGDYKTVAKMGFETGDPLPKKADSRTYNIFTTSAKNADGGSISNINTTPAATAYTTLGITPPVAAGESFGTNAIMFDFTGKNIVSTPIRARVPFLVSETCTITSGKMYRASVWIRVDEFAEGVTKGGASITIGSDINTDSSNWYDLNKGQWTKLTYEFVASKTFTSNVFCITIRGLDSTSQVNYTSLKGYFDNFRIEEFQDTKTGSEVVSYTNIGAASGTPYGTGTDTTYTLATGSSASISAELAETYESNSNTVTYPTARGLYNANSPVYYPHMPAKIFKKTSTAGTWLVRLSKAFDAADFAEGDKVRISMDVYNTDAVAHAKLKDGEIGAPVELDTQTIAMYPTGGASATDVNEDTFKVKEDVPVDTWYRLEKIITIPSDWAATGVRIDTSYAQQKVAGFANPFASTTYFTNFKYEKITDTSAKVNVGVSSEIAGLTVTGAGEYNVGSNATVTAPATTSDKSKAFKGWYDGYVCVSTDASYTFTAVTPVNLVAKYEENKVILNVIDGDNGTVTTEDEGSVPYGTEVTVSATPSEGYVFEGWYDNTTNVIVSRDAEYTFNMVADTTLYPYFIPAAVNGWHLLSNVDAEDGWNPSTSSNFWGKDPSTTNGNSENMSNLVSYESEAESIQKPNDTEDFGSMLIKADKANQPTATTGVGTFRINGINDIRYNAGDTYKMSAWMYIAQTDDETKTEVTVPMNVVYNAGGSQMQDTKTVTVPVGEWTKVESIFTVAEDSKLIGCATTGWRASLGAYVTVMYMDNFKIEKFDGATVSAEATNGTVYGTGSYVKGASVTLNAGADAGYKFAGYYTKDTDELISANPTYTFTANADTTIVAKFVQEDAFTYPSSVIYHFGSEEDEINVNGWNNNWMAIPTGTNGAYKQDSDAPHNMEITYKDLAAEGIYKPYESAEFGSRLYQQKRLEGDIKTQVSGRFRGWENGGDGISTKYKAGHSYKFTWWVMPVSMQLANDEESEPATTKLTVNMQYSSSATSGLSKTFTLNVGQWNKLEWTFVANDKMTQIAPGLRYDWDKTKNSTSGLITSVNWALYDEIQVEELTSWQFDDATAPANWYNYLDQADAGAGASNNNIAACSVISYADAGIEKASEDAGDKVVKMDYSKPDYTEAKYNAAVKAGTLTGDYANMTYEEAYAHLSRPANWGGDLSFRFRDIVAANVLTLGNTYKISVKVYIAKKTDIETGADTTSNTSVRIIGTRSGHKPEGDGKNVAKSVPFGQWTEVSYTFKATEAGVDFAPSLKVEIGKTGEPEVIPSIVYIDDVRVDQIHVDNLDLEITGNDTTVTATATVYDIKSGDTVDAIVIIAGYDADGKLVSVSFSNNGASKALAINESISATYTKADTVDSYVAFLWNDLTNIRPYVKPVPLSTGEVTE